MNIKIQILSLIIYYLFGIFLYILMLVLKNKKNTIFSIISFFLVFLIINYHINRIIIHPYFLCIFVIGFFSSKIYVKRVKRLVTLLKPKNTR